MSATESAATVRRRFLDDHECNAYCRNGRHSTVILAPNKAVHDRDIRDLCAGLRLRYITHRPAPEYRAPADHEGYGFVGDRFVRATLNQHPFLLIYEVQP